MPRRLDWLRPPSPPAQPRPSFNAAQLLTNADFVGLYEDPESPVVRRIAELEAKLRDLSITELPVIMALKGELEGFLFVRRSLAQVAEMQATQDSAVSSARPHSGLLPVRPS